MICVQTLVNMDTWRKEMLTVISDEERKQPREERKTVVREIKCRDSEGSSGQVRRTLYPER